jgi:hypothetical protein
VPYLRRLLVSTGPVALRLRSVSEGKLSNQFSLIILFGLKKQAIDYSSVKP